MSLKSEFYRILFAVQILFLKSFWCQYWSNVPIAAADWSYKAEHGDLFFFFLLKGEGLVSYTAAGQQGGVLVQNERVRDTKEVTAQISLWKEIRMKPVLLVFCTSKRLWHAISSFSRFKHSDELEGRVKRRKADSAAAFCLSFREGKNGARWGEECHLAVITSLNVKLSVFVCPCDNCSQVCWSLCAPLYKMWNCLLVRRLSMFVTFCFSLYDVIIAMWFCVLHFQMSVIYPKK